MKQRITGKIEIKTVKYNANFKYPDCPNYQTHDVTVIGEFSRWNQIPRKYVISDTYKKVRNEYCASLLRRYKETRNSHLMSRIKTRIEMVRNNAFDGETVSFSANVDESGRIKGRLSK